MAYILGIETSCDETAAAIYDAKNRRMLSSELFSQIDLHAAFGGVVPEIASRSHLEKIGPIVQKALNRASISLKMVDVVAVTTRPGLVGSLLIGLSFAKGIAWAYDKKLVGINHLDGHVFSAFLTRDGIFDEAVLPMPHICLSASGGHTAFHLVHNFATVECVGETIDDAAGEALDKIAYIMGLGYPGGAAIERRAREVHFEDFFSYPRSLSERKDLDVSFSGLKTAVLYHLVREGAFDLQRGMRLKAMTDELINKVASSLLVCVTDMCVLRLERAFERYPHVEGVSFVGGVAANRYMASRFKQLCQKYEKRFVVTPRPYCTDNAAMIALVGAFKAQRGEYDDFYLDVLK